MPAARAFEGPQIESRVIRLDPRKIHLRSAFRAPGAVVHVRVCGRVFELWHAQLQLHTGGSATELSATEAWHEAASGDEKTLRQS